MCTDGTLEAKVGGRPGRRLGIVRFPTQQCSCHLGFSVMLRHLEDLKQNAPSRTGDRPVRVQAEPTQPLLFFTTTLHN